MTLEEFNYIAEIFASIAVVASLIYVGLGVRQNTAATQASAGQAYVDTMNEFVGLINSSSSLADVLHRGASGLSNIKDGEIIQFNIPIGRSANSARPLLPQRFSAFVLRGNGHFRRSGVSFRDATHLKG